jgi:ArsR family metal-binding transcriptional regulator
MKSEYGIIQQWNRFQDSTDMLWYNFVFFFFPDSETNKCGNASCTGFSVRARSSQVYVCVYICIYRTLVEETANDS